MVFNGPMSATTTTYTAHLSTDDGDLALQVTRDIRGGICGPVGGRIFIPSGSSMERVERALRAAGFRPTIGRWEAEATFEGLNLTTEVEPVR